MTTPTTTSPRIYVGTYAKYNDGSIEGAWLDLEDYSGADEFEAACQELHGPGDHEFMFQDFGGIPEGMASESHLSAEFWDWLEMDDDDKEMLSVYRENVDQSGTLEQAQEAYLGTYASPEDWAVGHMNECMRIPGDLANYIDYKAYARDAGYEGVSFVQVSYSECWVFGN